MCCFSETSKDSKITKIAVLRLKFLLKLEVIEKRFGSCQCWEMLVISIPLKNVQIWIKEKRKKEQLQQPEKLDADYFAAT